MGKLKIAVYAASKNEAAHVDQYAETTKNADIVVVTDTGSTDGTPELLRAKGITVHNISVVPWRFDTAFNCALANIPADIDVCVKLDLDEVLYAKDGGNWRDEIEELWASDTIQFRYWYTWTWHVRGKIPATRFRTANIHAREGIVWRHPGHTTVFTYHPVRHKIVNGQNLEIHHYMTNKQRPDYIKLLSLSLSENYCPRTLYYLGRELHTKAKHKEAVERLTEYLYHPKSDWNAERADAMRMIARSSEALGDANLAMTWLMRAHGELPMIRELWYEVLRLLTNTGDFAGGYWAGTKTLAITERSEQWCGSANAAWAEYPYIMMAKCAWHTDRKDMAISFLKQALEINPGNKEAREFALTVGIAI